MSKGQRDDQLARCFRLLAARSVFGFGDFQFQLCVSALKLGDLLKLCFDPGSHPLGKFFGARVSLQVFAAVDLGLQGLEPGFVLFDPVSPATYLACPHIRIELIASQPKELFRLFPRRPARLAVFSRHYSGAERRADQLGYGVNPDFRFPSELRS